LRPHHTPYQVQNLAKKQAEEENPKKKSQGASELAGGETPTASRSKKNGKVPKVRRDGTPKPSSSSGEGGHGKSDSLFQQFARMEREGWNQEVPALCHHHSVDLTARFALQAVVAELQNAPKIELNHKAVLGRLAYDLKQRQLCMLILQFSCLNSPLIPASQQVAGRKRTPLSRAP
jgi:hypothetical protein